MVSFLIPSQLRGFADGRGQVQLDSTPADVGRALNALWQKVPSLRDRIVDEQGGVRQHVNIFVGADSIRFTGGLETPIAEGSEITIVPAVSGG